MDLELASYKFLPILDELEKDGDMAFIVHVCKETDHATAYRRNMDKGDALEIMKRLVKIYDLNPIAVLDVVFDGKMKVVNLGPLKHDDDED